MIFQDPLSAMHPFYTVGHQIIEAYRIHNKVSAGGRQEARHRHARPGRHPPALEPRRRLPAPVLRRHAPARDDRDGPLVRPRPAHRRRADDRARRHGAGPDPRPHPRPAGRVQLGRRHHHPRPRGRRRALRRHHGDVCRSVGGVRRRHGGLRAAPAPLHLGPAQLDAAARPGAHRAPAPHPGRSAEPHQRAVRLPVPPALRLPAAAPAASSETERPPFAEAEPGHWSACHLPAEVRSTIWQDEIRPTL